MDFVKLITNTSIIFKEGEKDNNYTFLEGLQRLKEINQKEPIVNRYGLIEVDELNKPTSSAGFSNFFMLRGCYEKDCGSFYFYNVSDFKDADDECRLKEKSLSRTLTTKDILGSYSVINLNPKTYEWNKQQRMKLEVLYEQDDLTRQERLNREKQIKNEPYPEEYEPVYEEEIKEKYYKIIDIIKILTYWNCCEYRLFTREQCEEQYNKTLQECKDNLRMWMDEGFKSYIEWMKKH